MPSSQPEGIRKRKKDLTDEHKEVSAMPRRKPEAPKEGPVWKLSATAAPSGRFKHITRGHRRALRRLGRPTRPAARSCGSPCPCARRPAWTSRCWGCGPCSPSPREPRAPRASSSLNTVTGLPVTFTVAAIFEKFALVSATVAVVSPMASPPSPQIACRLYYCYIHVCFHVLDISDAKPQSAYPSPENTAKSKRVRVLKREPPA